MNLTWRLNRKGKTILECQQDHLEVAHLKGHEILGFEKIPLRESSEEHLLSRIQSFNGKGRSQEAILILPSEALLEREFEVSPDGGEDLRGELRKRILQVVPYDLKSLSYSVEVEESGESLKARLLAVPRTYLDRYQRLIAQSGLFLQEVISREEALLFGALELIQEESFSLLHLEEETLELLLVKEGKLTLSRTFSLQDHDLFHDLELSFLEGDLSPKKIYLAGREDRTFEPKLLENLSLPLERLPLQGDIPLTFLGASSLEKHKPLSLLPGEIRTERFKREWKREARSSLLSLFLFISLILSGFLLHTFTLQNRLKALHKELQALQPEIQELTRIQGVLQSVNEAKEKKYQIFDLLKELSLKVPGEVTFKGLTLDEEELRIQGESPTYQGVSGTLSALEGLPFIKEAKLEYARLRKKLSQDFFDFEVKAQWKG